MIHKHIWKLISIEPSNLDRIILQAAPGSIVSYTWQYKQRPALFRCNKCGTEKIEYI